MVKKGLWYIPTPFLADLKLDFSGLKLHAFPDASFANNEDLSSQLGMVLVLGNEHASGQDEFTLHGNIVHYASTKSRRVTRAVLTAEVLAMVNAADSAISISETINRVAQKLGFPPVPVVICTDSRSLYDCLVKLGTTKEKRLMIDIMALRESYERRELTEIRWISGEDNPADAFTKAGPNKSLSSLVDHNKLRVRIEGWVQRKEK